MKHSRLLWRIYLFFLAAALAAFAIVTLNAVQTLRQFHEETTTSNLDVFCRIAGHDLLRRSPGMDAQEVAGLCKEMAQLTGARVTVVLPGGKVVGDSDKDPGLMDNHATRPEIAAAFLGQTGVSVRYSDTLKMQMKYVAVPIAVDGVIVGVVRMSHPLSAIRWAQRLISRQILAGGLLAVLFFAVAALYLSRHTIRPLERMRHIAGMLAQGDLSARVPVTSDDEIGALARAFNEMADQLSNRIETIARQQVEQRAVLACMVEGVLAVNPSAEVLYLNDAAAKLLDIDGEHACGRLLQEVVRHHEVQEFAIATLTSEELSESETLLHAVPERHLQLHGAPLVGPEGRRIGGLVVINDISRLKRLERVRSDFVANVSHELKTPITALKGCVETLSGDAMLEKDESAVFTDMMIRQVGRLESIVDDLLSLSRAESEAGCDERWQDCTVVADVLERVVATFSTAAETRRVTLKVECPDDITAMMNGALIEQAVGNLVDNAVKYTAEDTSVTVSAKQEDDQMVIRVSDEGPGIERQHLPRIFERFYRVDKARSRSVGGTGLGLAIVKHIALAHKGNVSVESEIGEGTTFTLRLPQS